MGLAENHRFFDRFLKDIGANRRSRTAIHAAFLEVAQGSIVRSQSLVSFRFLHRHRHDRRRAERPHIN
jgi:hypothetical protein